MHCNQNILLTEDHFMAQPCLFFFLQGRQCSGLIVVYNLLLLSICRFGLGIDLLVVEISVLKTQFLPFGIQGSSVYKSFTI